MSWAKFNEAIRSLFVSISVFSLCAVALAGVAAAQSTFPGTGTGAIPDKPVTGCALPTGPPLTITFTVTGMPSGAPANVKVDMTATHTWVGDLDAKLEAPNGTSHVLFGSTGSTIAGGCGSANDLGGTYAFDNSGSTTWWGSPNPFPAGTYKTTVAGDQASPPAGDPTDMNAAFAGIPAMNGAWKLIITDGGVGDVGSVTAANLTLTAGGGGPTGQPANVDRDGDGKSDYAIIRDLTPQLRSGETNPLWKATSYRARKEILRNSPQIENGGPNQGSNVGWYFYKSGDGGADIVSFGEPATDLFIPEDFDGDGKADVAVWRGVAPTGPGGAFFYVLNSSTSTVDQIDFGVQGDNPTVTGDYDGDDKADPAVLRCPASIGQCFYYYRGSAGGGETTFVPWGNGTADTLFPAIGDFDGDGKYDFSIQRTNPNAAGGGQFVTLRSSDSGVDFVSWGLNSDSIAPGDYNGDGKTDYAVGRNQGGQLVWYVLSGDGSTVIHYGANFGIGTDYMTPGDYDGDGKTDIAVFRPNADPNANFWYVYRSSDNAVSVFEWGNQGDYPLQNWRVQ